MTQCKLQNACMKYLGVTTRIMTHADLCDNTIIDNQPSPERFGLPILNVENRVGIKRELQFVASVEFVGENSEHVFFLGM